MKVLSLSAALLAGASAAVEGYPEPSSTCTSWKLVWSSTDYDSSVAYSITADANMEDSPVGMYRITNSPTMAGSSKWLDIYDKLGRENTEGCPYW